MNKSNLSNALPAGSGEHAAALLPLFFPKVIEAFSASQVFGFFSFMMVLQLIRVKGMVPQTKGAPLEELQNKMAAFGRKP